jgi:hypothetical protein
MMKFAVIAFMTLIFAVPAFSKAHKDSYPQPCSELWTAVKLDCLPSLTFSQRTIFL